MDRRRRRMKCSSRIRPRIDDLRFETFSHLFDLLKSIVQNVLPLLDIYLTIYDEMDSVLERERESSHKSYIYMYLLFLYDCSSSNLFKKIKMNLI